MPGFFPICPGGLARQAGAMETDTMDPQTSSSAPSRRPLQRPFQGRMLTGTAAGVADYLGIDPTITRIGLVVLTLAGGAGIPLYLAGLLLIPDEGSDESILTSLIHSVQSR
jgi:phage shock protein PspC (stress-responsive transcriptional regulator)